MVTSRFEVWLVDLEPVKGSEISKTRPCLIISPNETNRFLKTVSIAAMTTAQKKYPQESIAFLIVRKDKLS